MNAAVRRPMLRSRMARISGSSTSCSTARIDRTTLSRSAASRLCSASVKAAYELFSRRGVRDVEVNEVVERARITKATLYHHFASKDDLVVAFLDLRERQATPGTEGRLS
jgi:hypothetical protein